MRSCRCDLKSGAQGGSGRGHALRLSHFGRQSDKSPKPRALRASCTASQARLGKPLYRAHEGDLRFQSRNSHACARMRSGGEGKMPIWPAGNIEALRIGKLLRIAVRRADAQREIGVRLERYPADDHPLADESVSQLVGTLETQTLLDGCCNELRIVSQTLARFRVIQQQVQTTADEIGGR